MLNRLICHGSIAGAIVSCLVGCRFTPIAPTAPPSDPTLDPHRNHATPQAATDRALTIGAAVSLRESLTAIAAEFERATGTTVHLSFAASGTLQRQIEQDAPIDLFLSADTQSLDRLAAQGEIDPATRMTIARNCLVAIVARSSPMPIRNLTDLTRLDRIAIGNPNTVPAGRYARAALHHAGIYNTLHTEHRLVFGEHVRQVLAYVERGEVDAAIVYATDAAITPETTIAYHIPTEFTPPILYGGAMIARSPDHDTARTFLAFLAEDTAQTILRDRGFRPSATVPNCAVPLTQDGASML